ncbi:hypothetical protein Patl1_29491 [Pistacia atlantica]|uniref:Uncharacterized protein n=1 Tax=Pistacia atlantica TaxID=434234 RepID=A0ACC1A8Z8_9ROSI|nr:hypothetical protein Patl1_29491 [Pistacia atlantica]
MLSPKLTEIRILSCEKLKVLPNYIYKLTSLQELTIEGSPGIVSFPEKGLPINLTFLEIENLRICRSVFEWGLQRLTSLRQLMVGGRSSDVVSFPQVPSSLTGLEISDFPNLESLSSIDRDHTSLEDLFLFNCPKLKSFPDKGLPSSLLALGIIACPLLQHRCKKDKGQYWPMIIHIPSIHIC